MVTYLLVRILQLAGGGRIISITFSVPFKRGEMVDVIAT